MSGLGDRPPSPAVTNGATAFPPVGDVVTPSQARVWLRDWRSYVAIACSWPLWHVWRIGDNADRLMQRIFRWAEQKHSGGAS